MRNLEDILNVRHDVSNREVLFEDGEWCIYRRVHDRCYIIHRCATAHKAMNPTDNECHACSEVMPEALKGLFILHEWER